MANEAITGACRPTLIKCTWMLINALANMDVISTSGKEKLSQKMENKTNRLLLTAQQIHFGTILLVVIQSPMRNVYLSVDGTECPIQEPKSFSPSWFLDKRNEAGLLYDVEVSTNVIEIFKVSGPFSCGAYLAVRLFREDLKTRLGAV